MTEKKLYYGIGPVPKGKVRASPEQCIHMNQIRYYGIEAIDKTLLKKLNQTAPNLLKEQLKLKNIENQARSLINDYKTIKLILEKNNISTPELSKMERKMSSILNKKDILIKKFKKQKKIVDNIEKQNMETYENNSDEPDENIFNDTVKQRNLNNKQNKYNNDISDSKMYCGIGPVPKGMIRATPEYCLQTNQVRYYGIIAIDKDLLQVFKEGTSELLKEQLKMKKIEESAKLLIRDIKEIQTILDQTDEDSTIYEDAQEKMNDLQIKKKSIIKKLKLQKKKIEKLENLEKSNKK